MSHVLRTNINQERSNVKNLDEQMASESLERSTPILKKKMTNAQA